MDKHRKRKRRFALHKESLVVLTPQALATVRGGTVDHGGEVRTQCTYFTLICPVTSMNTSGENFE